MKSRKFIVGVMVAVVVITGYLGYTFNLTASGEEWQHRGLYLDQIRPYWWPVFSGLVVLLMVAIYKSSPDEEGNKGMSVSN